MRLRNSEHFLECKAKVEELYPDAHIVETKPGALWKLVSADVALSGEHDSHYACYVEALEKCK